MQIQNIQTISYCNSANSPNFKSWTREVLHKNSDQFVKLVKHRNDTWLFRDCLDWKRFGKFIVDKYKDVPKVKVINYACSNGSEAYTFLMEMFCHQDFDTAMKFTPIIAKDYDQKAIDYAQSGIIRIEEGEKGSVNMSTEGRFDLFFKKCSDFGDEIYEPRHVLGNNVIFSQANIIEDYQTIPPNNTIVLARNFWPYLKYNDRIELARNLFNHLGDNSTLVIGSFDNIGSWDATPTRQILESVGFKPTSIEHVYTKL